MNDVAVCISGAFRGDYLKYLKNIQDNLIEPLNADVFISTWGKLYLWPSIADRGNNTATRYLGQDIAEKLPNGFHTYNQLKKTFPKTFAKLQQGCISELNIESIKAMLPSLKKIELISEESFNNDINTYFNEYVTHGSIVQRNNQIKMYALLNSCEDTLNSYEMMFGKRYKYVVKARPDLLFDKKFNYQILTSISEDEVLAKFFKEGVDDKFFIGQRETMRVISSLFKLSSKIKRLSPFNRYDWAESHLLLTLFCIYNEISIVEYDFPYSSLYKSEAPWGPFPFSKELLYDIDDCNIEEKQSLSQLLNYLTNKVNN